MEAAEEADCDDAEAVRDSFARKEKGSPEEKKDEGDNIDSIEEAELDDKEEEEEEEEGGGEGEGEGEGEGGGENDIT